MTTEIEKLTRDILDFRDERDWAQFHTPRNLAAALAIEAAELQELTLWKTSEEVRAYLQRETNLERMSDEIADVMIFTLLLAHETGVDLPEAIRSKLRKNAEKYPVKLSKGSAAKYTELDSEGEAPCES